MNILSIDTSGKKLSVAIASGEKITSKFISKKELNHSRDIIIFIEKALKKSRLTLEKLDGFSIVIGPGSFTGLRIGVTAFKGLAYVTKKKIVGVSSLDVIASAIKDFSGNIVPIIDAKRNQVFAAIYKLKNKQLLRKSKYRLLPVEELLKNIKGKTIFLGDGVFLYKDVILKVKPDSEFAQGKFYYPDIKEAVKLGIEKFRKREFIDPFKLEPLYLYPKFCSIKNKK